jgi:hypothetical protein
MLNSHKIKKSTIVYNTIEALLVENDIFLSKKKVKKIINAIIATLAAVVYLNGRSYFNLGCFKIFKDWKAKKDHLFSVECKKQHYTDIKELLLHIVNDGLETEQFKKALIDYYKELYETEDKIEDSINEDNNINIKEIEAKITELSNLIGIREHGKELNKKEIKYAKENNLVVMYGSLSNCIELHGAIKESIYDTKTIYFTNKGIIKNKCNNKECYNFKKLKKGNAKVNSYYCVGYHVPNGWEFFTEIPHKTFHVYKRETLYCRGIIFSLDYLEKDNNFD